MADLESLNYSSISEMSVDEAIEMLRQIRLSRRIPEKRRKKTTKRKKKNDNLNISQKQALEILNILGGK